MRRNLECMISIKVELGGRCEHRTQYDLIEVIAPL